MREGATAAFGGPNNSPHIVADDDSPEVIENFESILIISDTEEEDDAKENVFLQLAKRARKITTFCALSENNIFPYAKLELLYYDLKKCLRSTNADITEDLIWTNVIQWLLAMKHSFGDLSDLKCDNKFNLLMTDFIAEYVHYRCIKFTKSNDKAVVNSVRNEILVALNSFFGNEMSFVLLTLLKLDFKDYAFNTHYVEIIYPIFNQILSNKKLNKSDDLISYVRLILCYKKWKTLVHNKEGKEKINAIAMGKYTLPGEPDGVLPTHIPHINIKNKEFALVLPVFKLAKALEAAKGKYAGSEALLRDVSSNLDKMIRSFCRTYKKYINSNIVGPQSIKYEEPTDIWQTRPQQKEPSIIEKQQANSSRRNSTAGTSVLENCDIGGVKEKRIINKNEISNSSNRNELSQDILENNPSLSTNPNRKNSLDNEMLQENNEKYRLIETISLLSDDENDKEELNDNKNDKDELNGNKNVNVSNTEMHATVSHTNNSIGQNTESSSEQLFFVESEVSSTTQNDFSSDQGQRLVTSSPVVHSSEAAVVQNSGSDTPNADRMEVEDGISSTSNNIRLSDNVQNPNYFRDQLNISSEYHNYYMSHSYPFLNFSNPHIYSSYLDYRLPALIRNASRSEKHCKNLRFEEILSDNSTSKNTPAEYEPTEEYLSENIKDTNLREKLQQLSLSANKEENLQEIASNLNLENSLSLKLSNCDNKIEKTPEISNRSLSTVSNSKSLLNTANFNNNTNRENTDKSLTQEPVKAIYWRSPKEPEIKQLNNCKDWSSGAHVLDEKFNEQTNDANVEQKNKQPQSNECQVPTDISNMDLNSTPFKVRFKRRTSQGMGFYDFRQFEDKKSRSSTNPELSLNVKNNLKEVSNEKMTKCTDRECLESETVSENLSESEQENLNVLVLTDGAEISNKETFTTVKQNSQFDVSTNEGVDFVPLKSKAEQDPSIIKETEGGKGNEIESGESVKVLSPQVESVKVLSPQVEFNENVSENDQKEDSEFRQQLVLKDNLIKNQYSGTSTILELSETSLKVKNNLKEPSYEKMTKCTNGECLESETVSENLSEIVSEQENLNVLVLTDGAEISNKEIFTTVKQNSQFVGSSNESVEVFPLQSKGEQDSSIIKETEGGKENEIESGESVKVLSPQVEFNDNVSDNDQKEVRHFTAKEDTEFRQEHKDNLIENTYSGTSTIQDLPEASLKVKSNLKEVNNEKMTICTNGECLENETDFEIVSEQENLNGLVPTDGAELSNKEIFMTVKQNSQFNGSTNESVEVVPLKSKGDQNPSIIKETEGGKGNKIERGESMKVLSPEVEFNENLSENEQKEDFEFRQELVHKDNLIKNQYSGTSTKLELSETSLKVKNNLKEVSNEKMTICTNGECLENETDFEIVSEQENSNVLVSTDGAEVSNKQIFTMVKQNSQFYGSSNESVEVVPLKSKGDQNPSIIKETEGGKENEIESGESVKDLSPQVEFNENVSDNDQKEVRHLTAKEDTEFRQEHKDNLIENTYSGTSTILDLSEVSVKVKSNVKEVSNAKMTICTNGECLENETESEIVSEQENFNVLVSTDGAEVSNKQIFTTLKQNSQFDGSTNEGVEVVPFQSKGEQDPSIIKETEGGKGNEIESGDSVKVLLHQVEFIENVSENDQKEDFEFRQELVHKDNLIKNQYSGTSTKLELSETSLKVKNNLKEVCNEKMTICTNGECLVNEKNSQFDGSSNESVEVVPLLSRGEQDSSIIKETEGGKGNEIESGESVKGLSPQVEFNENVSDNDQKEVRHFTAKEDTEFRQEHKDNLIENTYSGTSTILDLSEASVKVKSNVKEVSNGKMTICTKGECLENETESEIVSEQENLNVLVSTDGAKVSNKQNFTTLKQNSQFDGSTNEGVEVVPLKSKSEQHGSIIEETEGKSVKVLSPQVEFNENVSDNDQKEVRHFIAKEDTEFSQQHKDNFIENTYFGTSTILELSETSLKVKSNIKEVSNEKMTICTNGECLENETDFEIVSEQENLNVLVSTACAEMSNKEIFTTVKQNSQFDGSTNESVEVGPLQSKGEQDPSIIKETEGEKENEIESGESVKDLSLQVEFNENISDNDQKEVRHFTAKEDTEFRQEHKNNLIENTYSGTSTILELSETSLKVKSNLKEVSNEGMTIYANGECLESKTMSENLSETVSEKGKLNVSVSIDGSELPNKEIFTTVKQKSQFDGNTNEGVEVVPLKSKSEQHGSIIEETEGKSVKVPAKEDSEFRPEPFLQELVHKDNLIKNEYYGASTNLELPETSLKVKSNLKEICNEKMIICTNGECLENETVSENLSETVSDKENLNVLVSTEGSEITNKEVFMTVKQNSLFKESTNEDVEVPLKIKSKQHHFVSKETRSINSERGNLIEMEKSVEVKFNENKSDTDQEKVNGSSKQEVTNKDEILNNKTAIQPPNFTENNKQCFELKDHKNKENLALCEGNNEQQITWMMQFGLCKSLNSKIIDTSPVKEKTEQLLPIISESVGSVKHLQQKGGTRKKLRPVKYQEAKPVKRLKKNDETELRRSLRNKKNAKPIRNTRQSCDDRSREEINKIFAFNSSTKTTSKHEERNDFDHTTKCMNIRDILKTYLDDNEVNDNKKKTKRQSQAEKPSLRKRKSDKLESNQSRANQDKPQRVSFNEDADKDQEEKMVMLSYTKNNQQLNKRVKKISKTKKEEISEIEIMKSNERKINLQQLDDSTEKPSINFKAVSDVNNSSSSRKRKGKVSPKKSLDETVNNILKRNYGKTEELLTEKLTPDVDILSFTRGFNSYNVIPVYGPEQENLNKPKSRKSGTIAKTEANNVLLNNGTECKVLFQSDTTAKLDVTNKEILSKNEKATDFSIPQCRTKLDKRTLRRETNCKDKSNDTNIQELNIKGHCNISNARKNLENVIRKYQNDSNLSTHFTPVVNKERGILKTYVNKRKNSSSGASEEKEAKIRNVPIFDEKEINMTDPEEESKKQNCVKRNKRKLSLDILLLASQLSEDNIPSNVSIADQRITDQVKTKTPLKRIVKSRKSGSNDKNTGNSNVKDNLIIKAKRKNSFEELSNEEKIQKIDKKGELINAMVVGKRVSDSIDLTNQSNNLKGNDVRNIFNTISGGLYACAAKQTDEQITNKKKTETLKLSMHRTETSTNLEVDECRNFNHTTMEQEESVTFGCVVETANEKVELNKQEISTEGLSVCAAKQNEEEIINKKITATLKLPLNETKTSTNLQVDECRNFNHTTMAQEELVTFGCVVKTSNDKVELNKQEVSTEGLSVCAAKQNEEEIINKKITATLKLPLNESKTSTNLQVDECRNVNHTTMVQTELGTFGCVVETANEKVELNNQDCKVGQENEIGVEVGTEQSNNVNSDDEVGIIPIQSEIITDLLSNCAAQQCNDFPKCNLEEEKTNTRLTIHETENLFPKEEDECVNSNPMVTETVQNKVSDEILNEKLKLVNKPDSKQKIVAIEQVLDTVEFAEESKKDNEEENIMQSEITTESLADYTKVPSNIIIAESVSKTDFTDVSSNGIISPTEVAQTSKTVFHCSDVCLLEVEDKSPENTIQPQPPELPDITEAEKLSSFETEKYFSLLTKDVDVELCEFHDIELLPNKIENGLDHNKSYDIEGVLQLNGVEGLHQLQAIEFSQNLPDNLFNDDESLLSDKKNKPIKGSDNIIQIQTKNVSNTSPLRHCFIKLKKMKPDNINGKFEIDNRKDESNQNRENHVVKRPLNDEHNSSNTLKKQKLLLNDNEECKECEFDNITPITSDNDIFSIVTPFDYNELLNFMDLPSDYLTSF